MNYDAQQYTFSHGLATTPQLHLQQQQQQHFQQQHHIFQQQQYSQAVPSSSVYHFQFAGGSSASHVLHHQDGHSVGVSANMQQPAGPHGFVQQPFIKQAVPVAFDGNSVHVVGGLNGMIYSQQKSHVKNLPDLEGGLRQQTEASLQHGLLGLGMMAASSFTEHNVDVLQQQASALRVAGQGVFYDKPNCSGWLQPSQVSTAGGTHQTTGCQSALPSFSHLWSQFSHQKQIDNLQQHKHVHQYHSPQLQHPFQQQHMQVQQQQQGHQLFTTDASLQTLPGIQVVKMRDQPKAQQTPRLPQQPNGFPASQPGLFSSNSLCQEAPRTDKGALFENRGNAVKAQVAHSQPCTQPLTTYTQCHPATAVTYTVSGPPKFTVTLDSLSHSESFSLSHFPDRSGADSPSANTKSKLVNISDCSAPSVIQDNCSLQPTGEWQATQQQARTLQPAGEWHSTQQQAPTLQPALEWQETQQQARLPKPFLHSSSMGSSFERCSSESSSFSSPPYTFTPPSSVDLMFSPDHTHLSKTASESSISSSSSSSSSSSCGRTSTLSSSSSFMSSSSSSSPPASTPHWPGSQSVDTIIPTVTTASSVASSTCTTSTATVVFSCRTVALTTTSVTSTTANPGERATGASGPPAMLTGHARTDQGSAHSLGSSHTSRLVTRATNVNTAKQIAVPYSWRRTRQNGRIVYVSPSGTVLQSVEQICGYLLSEDTCKCGLECPIQVEQCFSFDVDVVSQPWTVGSGSDTLASLCNHRRHVVALAAFHSSQVRAGVRVADVGVEKVKKRERNKSVSTEGLIVAPLKRLKTSITNAVNRHAVSLGHVHSKPQTFGLHPPPHTSSLPPVGSCGNLYSGELKPGMFHCHRSRFQVDDEELLSTNVQRHLVDQAEVQAVHRQQFYDVDHDHHALMPAKGSLMFRLGPRKESVTSHHSPASGLQSNKLPLQRTASQLSQCHQQPTASQLPQCHQQPTASQLSQCHQQPTASQLSQCHQQPANMFYPQAHAHPHLPGTSKHRPPGYHPAVWKDDSHSTAAVPHPAVWKDDSHGTAAVPHSNLPRTYPVNINIQQSSFDRHQAGPSFLKHRNTPDQPSLVYQPSLGHQPVVDLRKVKSKRPKSKKEKQKHVNGIVDRSSPCSKASIKVSKVAVVPSTSATFFGNPIVFVEQQTAIINNSIASCHITCGSPSPPHCDTARSTSYRPATNADNRTGIVDSIPGRGARDLEKNNSVEKDEEDDQKTATDLDSNKSFSDSTENNDSAYLSQTGSDIDKSDAADALDSCCESKGSRATSLYCCQPAKARGPDSTHVPAERNMFQPDTGHLSPERNTFKSDTGRLSPERNMLQTDTGHLSPERNTFQPDCVVSRNNLQPDPSSVSAAGPAQKLQEHITLVTQQKRAVDSHKDTSSKKNVPNCLNRDLCHLLASNNWNMPALQQVLAQYSGADSGHLKTALQQALSQTLAAGADFPASNLLSAAARAQLHDKHRAHIPPVLTHQLHSAGLQQQAHTDSLTASSVSSSVGDLPAAVGAAMPQHIQSSYPCLAKGAGLVGNLMQLQQLPSGSFAVNMLLSGNGNGQPYASDSVHAGTLDSDQELKSAPGTLSQTGEFCHQVKLPVVSSSLASNMCSPDGNTMLLNSLAPRMIVNAAVPPVSVAIVTNVSKSLAQVVPAISINQTVFGSQQMLSSQQTAGAAAGAHILNTCPQAAQLVTAAAPGRQFNPTAANSQLVGSSAQTSQIVSVPGLSNQLVIASPLQQVSPSLSQLSPAIAAQILAGQGHQQLPQMSPSFLHKQLHKAAGQNILASVSLPTLTVTSSSLDSMAGPTVLGPNIHKNTATHELLETADMANKMSHSADSLAAPLTNSSLYAATSQPVFVLPQPSTNPLMQVLAPTQTLSTSTSLPDISCLSQMFAQSPSVDQSQLQSLVAAGLNPLAVQQMVNAVSLNGVQQQQQLQILQLQQLMLQQLQNQGQNIPGLPLTQASCASQVSVVPTPAIVSALVPQQLNSSMDLNSLHSGLAQAYQKQQLQQVPSNLAVQQVPSTLAVQHVPSSLAVQQVPSSLAVQQVPSSLAVQHVPSSLAVQHVPSSLAVQHVPSSLTMQHVPSSLAVQQMASVHCGPLVSVLHNGSVQKLTQTPGKHLQVGHSLQQQSIFSDVAAQTSQKPTSDGSTVVPHEDVKSATAVSQQTMATSCPRPAAVPSNLVKPSPPTKPKSKPKCRKSESKKMVDPETERNEEDVAATVQQILAQAVQQQRELSLAAKNQPPPPPKSKSKKSQSRSRTHPAAKEHDLGRLVSISDDVSVLGSAHVTIKEQSHPLGLLEPHHFTQSSHGDLHFTQSSHGDVHVTQSSHGDVQQSFDMVHRNHKLLAPIGLAAAPQGSLHVGVTMAGCSPGQVDQTTGDVNGTKKSSISLKDHLSFIISKDKDGHSKRMAAVPVQQQAPARASEADLAFSLQPTASQH